ASSDLISRVLGLRRRSRPRPLGRVPRIHRPRQLPACSRPAPCAPATACHRSLINTIERRPQVLSLPELVEAVPGFSRQLGGGVPWANFEYVAQSQARML